MTSSPTRSDPRWTPVRCSLPVGRNRSMSEIDQDLTDKLGEAVETASRPQRVPVNVYETDEALVVVAPLPGVMAEDVEISVRPGILMITAAMRTAAPKD